jgi:hypothetical protein
VYPDRVQKVFIGKDQGFAVLAENLAFKVKGLSNEYDRRRAIF